MILKLTPIPFLKWNISEKSVQEGEKTHTHKNTHTHTQNPHRVNSSIKIDIHIHFCIPEMLVLVAH